MTTVAARSQATPGPSSNAGQIIAWVVLLFALTVIGALPMLLMGVNLTKISQSTPHLQLILMGMLVTSCSPTLAALSIARFYPGAGGVRSLFRQVKVWRVGTIWYLIALIGSAGLLVIRFFHAVAICGVDVP